MVCPASLEVALDQVVQSILPTSSQDRVRLGIHDVWQSQLV
jgi:hypothetical protein